MHEDNRDTSVTASVDPTPAIIDCYSDRLRAFADHSGNHEVHCSFAVAEKDYHNPERLPERFSRGCFFQIDALPGASGF